MDTIHHKCEKKSLNNHVIKKCHQCESTKIIIFEIDYVLHFLLGVDYKTTIHFLNKDALYEYSKLLLYIILNYYPH